MNSILNLIKGYMSTTCFLLLSMLVYFFSGTNEYVQDFIQLALPINGRILAFLTFLGLIFLYEISMKHRDLATKGHNEIKEDISCLSLLFQRSSLISDVNQAFTEFENSKREFITGEYYIKEIMSLNDIRERLGVNSYTENKLKYLITKIKYDEISGKKVDEVIK